MNLASLLVFVVLTQVQYEPDYPGESTYHGVEVTIDLPNGLVADGGQRVKNFGAPRDNKGLCVFASMDMSARWQYIPQLIGIIAKLQTGGGWPERVEKVVREYAPGVEVAQYEGADPAFLDLAIKTGRAVCVTYGYGKFYSYRTIPHMVMLTHLDSQLAAIIDNNDPLYHTWMSRAEFLRRWVHPHGQGWAYVLITPPPPPPPRRLAVRSTYHSLGDAMSNRRRKVA
jgi:hypothetical protein